jgi:hypothetical protein
MLSNGSSGASRKQRVFDVLFQQYLHVGNPIFTNNDVKRACHQVGFGNPFDATKVDTREGLPQSMRTQNYCIAHLGGGRHQFIRELHRWFHDFETIEEKERFL